MHMQVHSRLHRLELERRKQTHQRLEAYAQAVALQQQAQLASEEQQAAEQAAESHNVQPAQASRRPCTSDDGTRECMCSVVLQASAALKTQLVHSCSHR